MVEDSVSSFSMLSITLLDLLSLALMNIVSILKESATILTIEVFPIPGGPEIIQALAFRLAPSFLPFFFLSLLTGEGSLTSFPQSISHCLNYSTKSEFPTKSLIDLGIYFAVHKLLEFSYSNWSLAKFVSVLAGLSPFTISISCDGSSSGSITCSTLVPSKNYGFLNLLLSQFSNYVSSNIYVPIISAF